MKVTKSAPSAPSQPSHGCIDWPVFNNHLAETGTHHWPASQPVYPRVGPRQLIATEDGIQPCKSPHTKPSFAEDRAPRSSQPLKAFEAPDFDRRLTHLVGLVPDQGVLSRLLRVLRDLNIELAWVNPVCEKLIGPT